MKGWVTQWGDGLRIQHKVWAALLVLCVPLSVGIALHLYVVQQLLVLQQQRQELMLAEEQVHLLGRLAIDIEDGFRGYALTQSPAFLAPLADAEARLDQALANATTSLARLPGSSYDLVRIEQQLKILLRSKLELIADIRNGQAEKALAYVQSGEGLRLSDLLLQDLRTLEDRLERERNSLHEQADGLSQRTFIGLWATLAGVVALGWIVSRALARSLTDPITRLQSATARIGAQVDVAGITQLLADNGKAKDELGQLADAYLAMARRIEMNLKDMEALDAVGHEINATGPDDLDAALCRITDQAVGLLHADICLLLFPDERENNWMVEAASGAWNDRLKKSVVPWKELPVCVKAFETRGAAVGDRMCSDEWLQSIRINLVEGGVLAIPLLTDGIPIGVLSFLSARPRAGYEWNQRLAEGLAQEIALAILNARLRRAAQQKQRGLMTRLRQLEHLAEVLAHDLKGPGARMEELARLLIQQDGGRFDARTKRWLSLIQENGKDLVQRVEGILTVARVGAEPGIVEAVDPAAIIGDVIKSLTEEIQRLHAVVSITPGLPLVTCHGAHLRQVLDNLVSNALKFARQGEPPAVKISARVHGPLVIFAVEDNGIGIPSNQRTRVFQPFVRLLMSEATGSGIGLTITQRIVELYGGRVWIDEPDGPGCVVRFTVPGFQEHVEMVDEQVRLSARLDVVGATRRKIS
ncbi:MAG: CHASE3 domain-containing protein [Nitrospira sp.]|nr:CHASE3 domain-containing protein [Nitrospira sp.]